MAEIEKSLSKLAEEINAEHRAFVGTFRKTVEHGIRAGELLVAAKQQCPHGTWLPWLEESFEGAPRTAQEYMRLYNHRDEILAKTRDSAHLSIGGALRELAEPRGVAVHHESEDMATTVRRLPDGTLQHSMEWTHRPEPSKTFEDRQYEKFKSTSEFIATQLWELVSATTARFEDIPKENPLPEVMDAFEWRQALALLEHKRDEQAARWVELYAEAGRGRSFDMRNQLGYVLRHNEYADIGRLEEDIKILRAAGQSYAALANALEAGMEESANG